MDFLYEHHFSFEWSISTSTSKPCMVFSPPYMLEQWISIALDKLVGIRARYRIPINLASKHHKVLSLNSAFTIYSWQKKKNLFKNCTLPNSFKKKKTMIQFRFKLVFQQEEPIWVIAFERSWTVGDAKEAVQEFYCIPEYFLPFELLELSSYCLLDHFRASFWLWIWLLL